MIAVRGRPNDRTLLLAAIAFVLGSGSGVFLWFDRPAPATIPAAPAGSLARIPVTQRPRLGPAAPSEPDAPPDGTGLDSFWKLLAESEKEPVAREFASEFKRQTELRKLFESFKGSRGSSSAGGSLRELARKLGPDWTFRKLLAKFAQEPGFRDVAERFMRFLDVREALRAQQDALRAEFAGESSKGTVATSVPRYGVRPKAGPPMFSAAVPSAGGPATPGAPAAAALSLTAEQPGSRQVNQEASPGPSIHEVERRLLSIGPVGGDRDAADALASLCYKNDPAITHAQCEAIAGYLKGNDLWESCVKAGLYETCRSLCAGKPELDCGAVPNFFDVCVQAGEGGCRARCQGIAGCTAPPKDEAAAPAAEEDGSASAGVGGVAGGQATPGRSCRTGIWEEEQFGPCVLGKTTRYHYSCTQTCNGGKPQPKECRSMYSSQESCGGQ